MILSYDLRPNCLSLQMCRSGEFWTIDALNIASETALKFIPEQCKNVQIYYMPLGKRWVFCVENKDLSPHGVEECRQCDGHTRIS